ncbi:MAG: hypothetical protein PHH08_03830 [Candidatus ainarchaeum sp.]|nr:hypothetical protein [Candidatus ainarchaeum sp.]
MKLECKLCILLLAVVFSAATVLAECGNEVCEAGENFSNCPIDCQNTSLEIILESPAANQVFLHGDTVIVKARLFDSQKNVLNPDYFSIRGFFGNIALNDDGDHNDAKWKDGVFGGYFKVWLGQPAGVYPVSIVAGYGKTNLIKKINIEIKPELTTSLKTDRGVYYLGDEIIFAGTVARHETPLKKKFELLVADAKGKQYRLPVETNAEGIFTTKLHTSLIDAPGIWAANFNFLDDFNNTAKSEIKIEVKSQEARSSLSIELIEGPLLFYRRGNDLLLLVKVRDDLGKELEDANIELVTPNGLRVPFEKSDANQFFVAIKVPVSMPSGKQSFTISAKAISENAWKSGDLNLRLNIKDLGVKTELLSPMTNEVQVGDTVVFSVRMYYENGEPLSTKFVDAKVNSEQLRLDYEETGVYSGRYTVKPGDSEIDFTIDFTDEFQNKGSFGAKIGVEGISIQYYLKEYFYYILAVILAVVLALFLLRRKMKARLEISRLRRKMGLYSELMEKADKDFVEGTITRGEFNRITTKYSAELAAAKARLEELEVDRHARKE